jgi:hypothetical protein
MSFFGVESLISLHLFVDNDNFDLNSSNGSGNLGLPEEEVHA